MFIAMVLLAFAVPAGAQTPLPATDVTAAQLKAFIDRMPKDAITDSAIRAVDVGGSRIGIYGVFRPKSLPGDAIAHETKTTEVYYILEGGGTLVTGGTIRNPKARDDGRPSTGPRGEKIDGGVTRHVTSGDIIVIPGRTPHWWSSLDGDLRYLIVRADPVGTMTLK
jgi:mannose-6-phosphate isomerase-like protein (cupin superfamily)